MTTLHLLAPAKINLGLEIIGKRTDGYHDIATVMQTVSLFDRLTVRPGDDVSLHVDDPALAGDDNLVLKAARTYVEPVGKLRGASITLRKRIPAAAGLGGASSDAAATLIAMSALGSNESVKSPPGPPILGGDECLLPSASRPKSESFRSPPSIGGPGGPSSSSLHHIAAAIGSDVPFLLTGGTAIANGRGDELTALPPLPPCWFVLLTPPIQIPRKTASLYGALTPADFSSGGSVRDLADAISRGQSIEASSLGNAFWRALRELRPEIIQVERRLLSAGASFVTLSGAGPTLYTLVKDFNEASAIARRLRATQRFGERIMVCRPVARVPLVRFGHG